MMMRRFAYIAIAAMIIIAIGLIFNFDGFKVLAVLAFFMSIDLQIAHAIRYLKMKAIMEALKDEESE